MLSPGIAFFQLATVILLADGQGFGIEVVCLPFGDPELSGNLLVRESIAFFPDE